MTSCLSNTESSQKNQEAIPSTFIKEVAESANNEDTILHVEYISTGDTIFEWKVQIKNLYGAFNKVIRLKDSSFVTSLNDEGSSGYLSSGFFDSKGHSITDYGIKGDALLKVTKNGEKEWLKRYYPESEFTSLISYTVTSNDKIIALVSLEAEYFRKLEEEQRRLLEEVENDEPIEENHNDHETEQLNNEMDGRSFGLQFFNKKGDIDSIVVIEDLSTDIEVLSIKPLNKDKFVIAGIYYGSIFKNENISSEKQGDFIVVINTNGKILWSDIMQIENHSHYVHHPMFMDISVDGDIYLCSVHNGEVISSKGINIRSKQKSMNEDSWTYLVSYSQKGTINWVRSNETISYAKALAVSAQGIYLAQRNYGNTIFNSNADTSGHIFEFLTFFDKKGNYQWSRGFPVNNISAIAIDEKGWPIIMGNYNDRIYGGPLKNLIYDGYTLNDKNDFFVIALAKNGKPYKVRTEKLNIRTDFKANRPQILLGENNEYYIICHSENYFSENFNEITFRVRDYVGDISFLGKLKMPK